MEPKPKIKDDKEFLDRAQQILTSANELYEIADKAVNHMKYIVDQLCDKIKYVIKSFEDKIKWQIAKKE